MVLSLTMDEYTCHRNDYDGVCTKCKNITRFGGTEPDAENYPCQECECTGNHAMGIENAMMYGIVEVE